MSVTRSVEFYCGRKTQLVDGFFGKVLWYQYSVDIAYDDKASFHDEVLKMKEYMKSHCIKIGFVDVSYDTGGGFSLYNRYKVVNKDGFIITKPVKYDMYG